MAIKLRNKGRSPLTLELVTLGQQAQVDVRIGRDPSGAVGRMQVERSFPRSVTIPGRGESEALPDAVAKDPAVLAQRNLVEVVGAPAAPAPPKDSGDAGPTASDDAPKDT